MIGEIIESMEKIQLGREMGDRQPWSDTAIALRENGG